MATTDTSTETKVTHVADDNDMIYEPKRKKGITEKTFIILSQEAIESLDIETARTTYKSIKSKTNPIYSSYKQIEKALSDKVAINEQIEELEEDIDDNPSDDDLINELNDILSATSTITLIRDLEKAFNVKPKSFIQISDSIVKINDYIINPTNKNNENITKNIIQNNNQDDTSTETRVTHVADDKKYEAIDNEHISDVDDGWAAVYTSDGRVYYQNNITKQTQWNKPMGMEEQTLPVEQPIESIVTVVQNDTNTPKYQQPIQQSRTETIVVHYIPVPQETIATPKKIELTVIQSAGNNKSNRKKRRRRSTIGEKNLKKRSTFGTVFIIIGMILAFVSMCFTQKDIFSNLPGINGIHDNDECEDFDVSLQIFILALIMLPLGLFSLLIHIVEYKTGDCACLRHSLMNILCLTWTKLCCCYDETSTQLLMLFNTLLWFTMFILDIIGIILFFAANQDIEASDLYSDCEKNEIGLDTYLEGIVMSLGFIVSIIELFYSGVGKCILKICCFLFVVAGIVAVIVAIQS